MTTKEKDYALELLIVNIESYENYLKDNLEPDERKIIFLKAYIHGAALQHDRINIKRENENFEQYLVRVKEDINNIKRGLSTEERELVINLIEGYQDKQKEKDPLELAEV